MKPRKMTPRDYALFEKEFMRVANKLGLSHCWDISFKAMKMQDVQAMCCNNVEAMQATIQINSERGLTCFSTNEDIKKIARHEAIELLLAPMRNWLSGFLSEVETNRLTHDVIQRLEKLL